ncbi:MAG: hemolysin family protein, partial [Nocardioidaceae bacterium]
LGDTLAREVMVPRTDMIFIERHKTLRQMMSLALRSGFSRIPVVGDNLDDVIGLAYLKDVTKRVFDKREAETTERIETVMRPAFFVPDSKPADELMRDMQARRMHVAVVVDEYGGTAGLITIEDILEEIVGEITDEYDVEPEMVEHLSGGAVRISSRMPLDDVGELFGVELEDEDVETIGGLMAKHLGKVPIPGAEVTCQGLHLLAESRAGRRNKVVTVVVTPVTAQDEGPGEQRPQGQQADATA